jgi:hypothetical protein
LSTAGTLEAAADDASEEKRSQKVLSGKESGFRLPVHNFRKRTVTVAVILFSFRKAVRFLSSTKEDAPLEF